MNPTSIPHDEGLALWTGQGFDAGEPLTRLLAHLARARARGQVVVSTNGCFDLLHRGHLDLLQGARELGDILVVGLNADASVRRLKGPGRPVCAEDDRAALLGALRPVDHVLRFDQDLPLGFIQAVVPHVHVKGGDYAPATMPETPLVQRLGGRVQVLPLRPGHSTSELVWRARNSEHNQGDS